MEKKLTLNDSPGKGLLLASDSSNPAEGSVVFLYPTSFLLVDELPFNKNAMSSGAGNEVIGPGTGTSPAP